VDSTGTLGLERGMNIPHPLLTLGAAALLLAACSGNSPFRRDAAPREADPTVTEAPGADVTRPIARGVAAQRGGALQPRGRTAAALDQTSDAERTAAAAAASSTEGRRLGETLAGLGAPAEPGFWLVTGLVEHAQPGRVVAPSGAALAVELRPSGGAAGGGSQMSLPAIRTLGLSLTELTTLQVFALD
jgi:hypothetical protein